MSKKKNIIDLSDIVKIWKILHLKNTSDIGFNELKKILKKVFEIRNDIDLFQPLKEVNKYELWKYKKGE